MDAKIRPPLPQPGFDLPQRRQVAREHPEVRQLAAQPPGTLGRPHQGADLVPALEQAASHVRPDEARGSRDQDSHGYRCFTRQS
jgi:hypothetical protein